MHVYAFVHGYIDIRIFILYDTHRVPIADAICRHRCRRKRNRLAYSVPQSVRRDRQIAPVARFFIIYLFLCFFSFKTQKLGPLFFRQKNPGKPAAAFSLECSMWLCELFVCPLRYALRHSKVPVMVVSKDGFLSNKLRQPEANSL